MGSNPHAEFEQMHPAVNKEEPGAFANPVEAGAKKLSEEQCGRAIPRPLTDDLQPRLLTTAAPRTPIPGWVQIPMQNSSRCIQQ